MAIDEPLDYSESDEPEMALPKSIDLLEGKLSEWDHKITEEASSLYSIQLTANGYEYMSDAIWYVDTDFNLRYYEATWQQEGMEGKSKFHLSNDKIACAMEEETTGGGDNVITYACEGMGGCLLTWAEGDENSKTQALDENYMTMKQEEIADYYDNTIDLIRKNKATAKGDVYRITLKNVVDVGEEFTEVTEITISKKLYDHILKEGI